MLRSIIVLSSICFLFTTRAVAEIRDNWADGVTSETVAHWADTRFQKAITENEIDAAVVSVVKDGKIIFANGYGLADAVEGRLATSTTPFRSGSVSKLFTAISILQLAERGLLSLNDDINDHLKRGSIKTPKGKTTIRHLITHSAGFDERFRNTLMARPDSKMADADYIKKYAHKQIRSPGEQICYSNYGMGVAGLIVEDVSGMPIGEYITKNIFQPLGMEDAYVENVGQLPDRVAKEYDIANDGSLIPRIFKYKAPFFLGSGGFFYSAIDMAKFANAVIARSTDLLSEGSWDIALTMQKIAGDGFGGGIGYGFWIYEPTLTDDFQVTKAADLLGHGGLTEGFSSSLMLSPKERVGIFVSLLKSNVFDDGFDFSGSQSSWEFIGHFRGYRRLPEFKSTDQNSYTQFAGRYIGQRRAHTGPEVAVWWAYPRIKHLYTNENELLVDGKPLRRVGPRTFEGLTSYNRPFILGFDNDADTLSWNASSLYDRNSPLNALIYSPSLVWSLIGIGLTGLIAALWPGRKNGLILDRSLALAGLALAGVVLIPLIALHFGDQYRFESPRYLIQALSGWFGIGATLVAAIKYALDVKQNNNLISGTGLILFGHRTLVLSSLIGLAALYLYLDIL
ncbi:MAG: serine hydrolase domain-containing protein [Pseudomonadota bacterium]